MTAFSYSNDMSSNPMTLSKTLTQMKIKRNQNTKSDFEKTQACNTTKMETVEDTEILYSCV